MKTLFLFCLVIFFGLGIAILTFWGIKYSQITVICNSQPETRILDTSKCAQLGEFCGGIANIICCENLNCLYDGNYPDSGGKCLESNQ